MSHWLCAARSAARFALAVSLFAGACSHLGGEVAPAGIVAGSIPPVAGVGSATSVSATAADGTVYMAAPNALTGAFKLVLPPGSYVLTFTTTLSAPSTFPARIPVIVTAGATTTPALPPLTHDGKVRGTLKWTVDGVSYAATWLNGQFSDRGSFSASKGCFYLFGRAGDIDQTPVAADMFLVLPEASRKGVIFVGPATYTLGGEEIGSYGEYTYYVGGKLTGFTRYSTPDFGTPAGTLRLTSYDATQGAAAGSFDFVAAASVNATGQRTVTNGEFSITF